MDDIYFLASKTEGSYENNIWKEVLYKIQSSSNNIQVPGSDFKYQKTHFLKNRGFSVALNHDLYKEDIELYPNNPKMIMFVWIYQVDGTSDTFGFKVMTNNKYLKN